MSDQTASSPDYQGAKRYALGRLEQELPTTLFYHSLWHTRDEVAVRAQWLARQEGLSQEVQHLIGTASYFHDMGFVLQRADHEVISTRIAAEILPQFGFRPHHIAIIQGMILATQLPQSPQNRLEAIVADADLDVLGREDFFSRNLSLRAELAKAGITTSDGVWYSQQLQFMQQHRYFTKTAHRQRAQAKQHNLLQLRGILADCCPQLRESPVAVPSPSFAVS